MSKEHFMLRWCRICFVSFLLAMRTASQLTNYVMLDDLAIDSSFSIPVKKLKIIQYVCQKEHRSELLKHIWRQVRYVEKEKRTYCFFSVERQRSF